MKSEGSGDENDENQKEDNNALELDESKYLCLTSIYPIIDIEKSIFSEKQWKLIVSIIGTGLVSYL